MPFPPEFNDAGDLEIVRPIVRQNRSLGTLHVLASMDALRSQVRDYFFIAGTAFIGSLLAAILLSSYLQKFLTEPILTLAQVEGALGLPPQDRITNLTIGLMVWFRVMFRFTFRFMFRFLPVFLPRAFRFRERFSVSLR